MEHDGDSVASEHDNIGNGDGDNTEQLNGDTLPDIPMPEQYDVEGENSVGDGNGDDEGLEAS